MGDEVLKETLLQAVRERTFSMANAANPSWDFFDAPPPSLQWPSLSDICNRATRHRAIEREPGCLERV